MVCRVVEEVLFGNPFIRFWEKDQAAGEDLYVAYGQTDAGRYLVVFFIRKPQNMALPISTRDMTDYLDEFRTVEINTELRARHFEVEIDESVAKVLQTQAREQGIKVSDLASTLLRRQLGMAA